MIQIKAEGGQTMAEYAVVLGVITIAIVTTFALLSGAINESFETRDRGRAVSFLTLVREGPRNS